MYQVKVSVCISVYNTEKYIGRCLESVVNQTLKEMEIVIVNDGSTDKSLSICEYYRDKYTDRIIKIISQENKGLAIGRKTGISNASGEYIAFLDADDYADVTMYEKMYNYAIKENADIVEAGSLWGNRLLKPKRSGVSNSHDYLRAYFWGNPYIWPMLWLRIYRRELFNDLSVLPDLYCNNEDIFGFPCLLYKAKTIAFLNEQLHYYSVDFKDSVERGMKQNKDKIGKYYSNRKTKLESINHIRSFIGEDNLIPFIEEFNQHIQMRVVEYLHTDICGVTNKQKYSDICYILKFNSSKEVNRFIRKNTKNGSKYNITILLLGIKLSKQIKKCLRC